MYFKKLLILQSCIFKQYLVGNNTDILRFVKYADYSMVDIAQVHHITLYFAIVLRAADLPLRVNPVFRIRLRNRSPLVVNRFIELEWNTPKIGNPV